MTKTFRGKQYEVVKWVEPLFPGYIPLIISDEGKNKNTTQLNFKLSQNTAYVAEF